MPPPLFLLLLISTAAIIRGQNTITIPFPTCPPSTTCGNHTNISYPFFSYTHSRPTSFCGYQSFAVHCLNNTPFLPLVDTDNHLVVTAIDYARRTLSLSDPVAAFTPCPDLPGSLRPITQLLTQTPTDAVLTFFLNCTRRPDVPAGAGGGPVPCLNSGGNSSYLFAGQYVPKAGWPCSDVLPMPATKSVADYIFTTSAEQPPDLGRVMREGFQLEWPDVGPGECGECERSGGRCGYKQSGSGGGGGGGGAVFGCYCGDRHGWRTRVCGKKKKNKGIIIGMSVTAGILLISILCFIGYWCHYRRQQKQQRSPSSALMTYPSSTTGLPFSDKDKELTVYPYQTHIFTYEELLEATNSFSTSMEIGNGGFGTVYKGILRDGRTVAVKRLYESNFRRAEQFANEIVILSRLRHHNLVTLYGCSSPRSRELLLIYEFVPNGTVADHLFGPRTAEGRLQWPHRLSIAVETAAALAYLHAVDPPIIHRDVKTENILLDAEFHVKVADFGFSRHCPRNGATHISTAPLGTPGYLDPEYHRSYKLTDRSDVYSFGVVLAELISSKPAVDLGRDPAEINLSTMAVNRIQSGYLEDLIDRKLGYESDVKTTTTMRLVAELAFRCLQADREMRPAMKEVLEVLEGLQKGATIGSEKSGHFVEQLVDNAGVDEGTGKERPVSPESVTEKWGSRSTTPGCSH